MTSARSGSHSILPTSTQQECDIKSALVPQSVGPSGDPWREHDGSRGRRYADFREPNGIAMEGYPGRRPLST
jgi:hypothetical protein